MSQEAGVVAFAFGVPSYIRANRRIARVALRKAKELDVPIFTQADIWIGSYFDIGVTRIEVARIEEEPGNPPPTLRIARGAVLFGIERGIRELWVAAAKPHLWRCTRDLEYAVREAEADIEIRVCEGIDDYPEEEWFCPDSTQKRTQSRKDWESRERILKLMPMFLYKLVAS